MKDEASAALLAVELEDLRDDAVVVRLRGEIDISSANLMTDQIAIIAAQGKAAVILDATEVTFMDSTGLHALVEGKRLMHERGTQIFLVPSQQVRRVLDLVFPDRLFADRLDSVDDALAAIEGKATE